MSRPTWVLSMKDRATSWKWANIARRTSKITRLRQARGQPLIEKNAAEALAPPRRRRASQQPSKPRPRRARRRVDRQADQPAACRAGERGDQHRAPGRRSAAADAGSGRRRTAARIRVSKAPKISSPSGVPRLAAGGAARLCGASMQVAHAAASAILRRIRASAMGGPARRGSAGRRGRRSRRPAPAARHGSPRSTIRPSSSTMISSACISEDSRWAMITVALVAVASARASRTLRLGDRVDGGGGVVEDHDARAPAPRRARCSSAAAGRRRAPRRARRPGSRRPAGRPAMWSWIWAVRAAPTMRSSSAHGSA